MIPGGDLDSVRRARYYVSEMNGRMPMEFNNGCLRIAKFCLPPPDVLRALYLANCRPPTFGMAPLFNCEDNIAYVEFNNLNDEFVSLFLKALWVGSND